MDNCVQNSKMLTFEGHDLQIISIDGDVWLTGPQIGEVLGFSHPSQAIQRLYSSHSKEFSSSMTQLVQLGRSRTRVFSPRGAHLVAMFARTKKAESFRCWVLDVLEAKSAPVGLPAVDPLAVGDDVRRFVSEVRHGALTIRELKPNEAVIDKAALVGIAKVVSAFGIAFEGVQALADQLEVL